MIPAYGIEQGKTLKLEMEGAFSLRLVLQAATALTPFTCLHSPGWNLLCITWTKCHLYVLFLAPEQRTENTFDYNPPNEHEITGHQVILCHVMGWVRTR